MKAFFYFFLLIVACASAPAHAASLTNYINDPQTVGNARLEVMFWDIYDAELIAEAGNFEMDKPFALKLTYLRKFKGKDIASRSVDEMRSLGVEDEIKLAKWFEQMHSLFPDVKDGSTITGVVDNQKSSHFYYNSQKLGHIEDPEFSEWFFAIWLHEKSSEPKMRKQLLGLDD